MLSERGRMGLSRRIYTREFKLAAVERLERGKALGEGGTGGSERIGAMPLAAEIPGIAGGDVSGQWSAAERARPRGAIGAQGRPWRLVFRRVAAHRGSTAAASVPSQAAIYGQIEKQRGGQLTVERVCGLGECEPRGLYRWPRATIWPCRMRCGGWRWNFSATAGPA